jgi:aldose 1-epimerase
MTIISSPFGKLSDGTGVSLITMTNAQGLSASVTNYGGILVSLLAPDRDGRMADVVLGFDSLEQYETENAPHFGAICGRCANRIAGGRFTLDGVDYQLARNAGPNALHGGLKGFDKVVWQADTSANEVVLRYTSGDGEEGYPGNLDCQVSYALTDENELVIRYLATTDKPTVVNLTNHSYFNLSGGASADVRNHVLSIAASQYTPVDDDLIPTGQLAAVAGTPLDFTRPRQIGERLDEAGGYDHNFVLDDPHDDYVIRVEEPTSGRVLGMRTTEPGVQLYTANFLDGKPGKRGAVYDRWAGFCLEAQHFPDAVHHPEFPSTVLRPGETYVQETAYRFDRQS